MFRLGFADSRAQARQIVRHGHIDLNGRTTNIPSAALKIGDVITWSEGGKSSEILSVLADVEGCMQQR